MQLGSGPVVKASVVPPNSFLTGAFAAVSCRPAEAAALAAPKQAPSARCRAILCLSLMFPYQIRPIAFFTALFTSVEFFH